MTRVSIIIITLNEGESLRRSVDSLRDDLPAGGEIIIVDDGSIDGSTAFLRDGYPEVTLLRPNERLGVPRARNFGAEHAAGDVLVFSDAHVTAPAGWLDPLLELLERSEVGAVAPAIATMKPASFECTGYGQKWSDAALGVEWLARQNAKPYQTPLLCGCFLGMRRDVFTQIGGFDGGMVLWGAEDSEISIRLWTCGYECWVAPSVEVQHMFRAQFPYEVKWEPVLHNRLRLAALHFGPRRLLRVIERLKKYDEFAAASVRLLSGDLASRANHLRDLRRFDDDWFFHKFRNELSSDLCDTNTVSVSVADAPRVSACLVSWKRPQNLPVVVNALRRVEFIDEILVWNNDPATKLDLPESVRVIDSSANLSCYGRFRCAAEARNSIVYVQDDDALNGNIEELYARFMRDSSRIAHALASSHWNQRDRRTYGDAQVALLGWGAFFRKEWLAVLDELPPGIRQDPLFQREADAFFTLLLQRRHSPLLTEITHLDGHSTPGIALWCEPGYRRLTNLAIRQSLRLLRLKKNPGQPPAWNVVVSCYNYGCFLWESVESILDSDADYEIHIVDDASTDYTREVAQELGRLYPHVHYLRNDERRGPGHSRNRGVLAMDSSYVVLLDADDLIGPDYLALSERRLQRGADVVNPDAVLFGESSDRWVVPEIATFQMLLERNSVHCSAAFRRELWKKVGGVDERIPCWEDYHFWLRLAAEDARIQGLHGDHFLHRKHSDSLSNARQGRRAQFLGYIRENQPALYQSLTQNERAMAGV